MSSLTFLLVLLLTAFAQVDAKKRSANPDGALLRRRSQSPTPSATPTIAPISHAQKCDHDGSFSLINVFLSPPTPRKGDKVTLSVFYYAPVEVEDPDLIIATSIAGKTFIHKSSLCDNKLTKQEIHNRHLDEEQIPQDDDSSEPRTDDDSDIRQPPPLCRIRVGEHMDNIELTWLYEASPPLDITVLYGHEKTPLLCAKLTVNNPRMV